MKECAGPKVNLGTAAYEANPTQLQHTVFSISLLLCVILSVNQNSTLVDKFIVLSNILRWYNLFPRFFVQMFASKV